MTSTTTSTAPGTQAGPAMTDLPAGPRPDPPGALAASAAFGWRALLKIRHVPEQLFDVIAIPIVFTLMFTYLFGGALTGTPGRYLSYLLPGTLVMAGPACVPGSADAVVLVMRLPPVMSGCGCLGGWSGRGTPHRGWAGRRRTRRC